ncbi:MAG: energy-coupling factor transporter transmembrane component T [Nitriliruptoraceae bacterium]
MRAPDVTTPRRGIFAFSETWVGLRPRAVHPGAWWAWAVCLAIAASRIHHPLLLALLVAVAGSVVMARRTDAPWSRSFTLFLRIGLVVIAIRTIAQTVFGVPSPGRVLVTLPSVELPGWAAGIAIGGPITDTALAVALTDGMRLAAVLACIGAANALANPKRMLASLPAALYEVGVAVVIALSFAPSLATSVQRVRAARRLRGRNDHGIAGWFEVAVPVIDDALARSLSLAAAMDARGYGRTLPMTPRARRQSSTLLLTGLAGLTVGVVALLNAQLATEWSLATLGISIILAVTGIRLAGHRSPRSRYRPDPWTTAEWVTVCSGAITVAAVIVTSAIAPRMIQPVLIPMSSWPLPWLATGGILVAMLPGFATPRPADNAAQASVSPPRIARWESAT